MINKIAVVIVVLFSCKLWAFSLENLELKRNENQYYFELSPIALAGTHVDGLGINSRAGLRLNHSIKDKILSSSLSLYCYPTIYERYYGIPGNSAQINTGASISLTWGKRIDLINNPWVTTEMGMHSVKYFFSYFLASDSTSQPYGGVEYKRTSQKSIFRIRLDNDDGYILSNVDKYRTTFGEIEYLRYDLKNVYGLNLGFRLWTGILDSLKSPVEPQRRKNTYTMAGYGGEYSHGIVSLTIIYNFLRISAGYDSEEIRNTIQNGWHYLYDRPKAPLLNRDSRFYFQVSLFNSEMQY